jgi:hypothetical protein
MCHHHKISEVVTICPQYSLCGLRNAGSSDLLPQRFYQVTSVVPRLYEQNLNSESDRQCYMYMLMLLQVMAVIIPTYFIFMDTISLYWALSLWVDL